MLALRQIGKRFGSKSVAQNVSLQVAGGSITAVLGASGSGKSTLLKMAAGLEMPDSGEIWLNNVCLNPLPPEARQVAMMFQDFALLPHLNVLDNAAFGLRMRGMGKAAARARAAEVLAEVGLQDLAQRQIASLSGGEQQRTALARALAVQPQLLLLDEPFSSLDTALRGQLQTLIRALVSARGIPALLVTHDPVEACLMADNIAVLADGQIVQSGSPGELLAAPANAEVARLLGCANVGAAHYVPPDALRLHDENGEWCRIEQVANLPLYCGVWLTHPQWGALWCFCDGGAAARLQGETQVRVGVRRERVVAFAQGSV